VKGARRRLLERCSVSYSPRLSFSMRLQAFERWGVPTHIRLSCNVNRVLARNKSFWDVAEETAYSALMPAALMIGHHFSISAF